MLMSLLVAGGLVAAAPRELVPIAGKFGHAVGRAMCIFQEGKLAVQRALLETDDMRQETVELQNTLAELSAIRSHVRLTANLRSVVDVNRPPPVDPLATPSPSPLASDPAAFLQQQPSSAAVDDILFDRLHTRRLKPTSSPSSPS